MIAVQALQRVARRPPLSRAPPPLALLLLLALPGSREALEHGARPRAAAAAVTRCGVTVRRWVPRPCQVCGRRRAPLRLRHRPRLPYPRDGDVRHTTLGGGRARRAALRSLLHSAAEREHVGRRDVGRRELPARDCVAAALGDDRRGDVVFRVLRQERVGRVPAPRDSDGGSGELLGDVIERVVRRVWKRLSLRCWSVRNRVGKLGRLLSGRLIQTVSGKKAHRRAQRL